MDPAMGVENLGHFDGLCAASVRISQERDRMDDAVGKGRKYLEKAAVCDLAKASICCDPEVERRALDSGSYPPFQEPQRLERP